MATIEEASALITPVAAVVTIGRYCTLSAWIMLLYDYVVHLDKEVELFWMKPWGAAKGLYLFNRYAPMIFVGVHAMVFLSPRVTDGICLFWFKFEGYTGLTGIAAVELVLGFRVLALWNRSKIVIGIIAFAFLAEISTMLAILTSTYAHMGATALPFPNIPYRACIPSNIPPYFFAFWLPPLGYEFIVFCLAAGKGYATIKIAFQDFTFKTTGSRLLEVMVRDSLWYFLLIFGCDMACALVWLRGPDSLLQAVVGFGLVIPSVAGSHLLLNLRDAYYHPTGETTIGRSDYSRTGFGEVPTVHRGKDIFANEGRHHINGELDTSWALDSTQDYKSFISAELPPLPAILGSTSTFSQTRTIQFLDDSSTTKSRNAYTSPPIEFTRTSTVIGVHRVATANGDHVDVDVDVDVPGLHTQSSSPTHQPLSQSSQSSMAVHATTRRPSLLADEDTSSTLTKSRFVEVLRRNRQSQEEDHDTYELGDVISNNVHPNTPGAQP